MDGKDNKDPLPLSEQPEFHLPTLGDLAYLLEFEIDTSSFTSAFSDFDKLLGLLALGQLSDTSPEEVQAIAIIISTIKTWFRGEEPGPYPMSYRRAGEILAARLGVGDTDMVLIDKVSEEGKGRVLKFVSDIVAWAEDSTHKDIES